MTITPREIKNYFLRGLVITSVSAIVHIIVYAVIFILPTYLPEYWWLSWVIFLLWLPLSILFLGWLATEVVLHWVPAIRIEVKPAFTAKKYIEKITEEIPRTINARVAIKYTSGEWRIKNYWGYPESAFYDLLKEMVQSPFTEYVIVIYYDENRRFIRAVGEKGTSEIFESPEELKRFIKTH